MKRQGQAGGVGDELGPVLPADHQHDIEGEERGREHEKNEQMLPDLGDSTVSMHAHPMVLAGPPRERGRPFVVHFSTRTKRLFSSVSTRMKTKMMNPMAQAYPAYFSSNALRNM